MSRHGYQDCSDSYSDYPDLEMGRWRAQVNSAIRGQRGQRLLRDIATAMDSMTVRELLPMVLQCADGMCAMGAAAAFRGIDMMEADPEDPECVAKLLDVAHQLAREIAYQNDEGGRYKETPAQRWIRMREWVQSKIKEPSHG